MLHNVGIKSNVRRHLTHFMGKRTGLSRCAGPCIQYRAGRARHGKADGHLFASGKSCKPEYWQRVDGFFRSMPETQVEWNLSLPKLWLLNKSCAQEYRSPHRNTRTAASLLGRAAAKPSSWQHQLATAGPLASYLSCLQIRSSTAEAAKGVTLVRCLRT